MSPLAVLRDIEMKAIERFELTNTVARHLQARMTFDDISDYLARCGVPGEPKRGSYDSKAVYAKDILASASEETIVRIAEELKIPHAYTVTSAGAVTESKYWQPNHFRLFLSHLSSFKSTTAQLRSSLRRFAISGFVAHEDIEPATEWQNEIEAALFSMDALVALLTPGFEVSLWADQEVGIAIGRKILVVPVMRTALPHGFIGKFQGVNGIGKTVADVAQEIFGVLIGSSLTRNRLITCLVDTTVQDTSEAATIDRLETLVSVPDIPKVFLERLRDGAARSAALQRPVAAKALSALLKKRGIAASPIRAVESETDDEVPF